MRKWIIALIVLLGFLLRVIGLSNHPTGFTPDEASFGYDAYSILKTGKDQWGHSLPLVFKSFGDDKLPVYTYLAIPSVTIFGLNEFAVRFPNAILGTLAVLTVYLLVYELFKKKDLALFSAFLLTISPWHVMLSRGAFEANLTTFFLPLGIFLFLKGIKNNRLLYLSLIVFVVNMFTYHTARLLTPLVVASLVLIYKKELRDIKKFKLLIYSLFGLFVVLVFGYLVGGSRVASSSIFGLGFGNDRYFAQVAGEPKFISIFFYNNPLYTIKLFITNYLSYFSPQFLFTNGSGESTYGMVPGVGVLYLVEIYFFLGFSIKTLRAKNGKAEWLLIFWILVSPIPAALTRGPGYAANRSAFMMPAIQILLALGGFYMYESLKRFKYSKIFLCCFIVLWLANFVYIGERYWVGEAVNGASSMVYGTRQVVESLNNTENKGKRIIMSKKISEPQIYAAFYNRIDPSDYQKASKNWVLVNGWVDQQGEYSLGSYIFRNINYSVDAKLSNTMLVGAPNDFPVEITPSLTINYPNGQPAYYIVNTK